MHIFDAIKLMVGINIVVSTGYTDVNVSDSPGCRGRSKPASLSEGDSHNTYRYIITQIMWQIFLKQNVSKFSQPSLFLLLVFKKNVAFIFLSNCQKAFYRGCMCYLMKVKSSLKFCFPVHLQAFNTMDFSVFTVLFMICNFCL